MHGVLSAFMPEHHMFASDLGGLKRPSGSLGLELQMIMSCQELDTDSLEEREVL